MASTLFQAILILSACVSLTSAHSLRFKHHAHSHAHSPRAALTNATATLINSTDEGGMRILGGTLTNSAAAPKVTDCSGGQQCTLGCCSTGGYCGYGPDFCGSKACIAKLSANETCAQLSECDAGGYPGYGALWGPTYAKTTNCPLNVCCSKFGFCGTTEDFCGSEAWPQPSCGGSSATARNIGYYEGWNQDHPCDHMTPEEIPIKAYTHLNFAFAFIDPVSYAVVPMAENQKALYKRFTGLKAKKPGLQTWISIGGWSFNDPGPAQKTFSQLAASASAQKAFFLSVLDFLKEYGFDGVDLDWEYPGAKDRGGVPEDFKNFVTFLSRMRSALGSYGLSITLPSSYWYLQHFDIVNLVKHVDFLSIMTYDVYGTWDSTIGEIGPYVYAHTNMTVIDKGLQLLWHNNIDPAKVNFGFGFYGRSYTLSNPSCKATGCEFSKGGNPGKCTGTEGILSYAEVVSVLQDKAINAEVRLDSKEMVKIATWKDQWIGYDDAETIKMKMDYANKHCLGGTLVWAVDLDTTYTLAGAVSGKNVSDIAPGGSIIYPDRSIWDQDKPEIVCAPPCTFILPPKPLATPRQVVWEPFMTSVLSSSDGTTYSSNTLISIPPFTISSVAFWPVTVTASDTDVVTFTPVQSIMPPTAVFTWPGGVTLHPPTPITFEPGQTSTGGGSPCETGGAKPVTTPSPVTANMPAGCTKFYEVKSGDGCWSIQNQFGLSAAQFESMNPDVGVDCSSGVWLNYYYCVAKGTQKRSETVEERAAAVETPQPINNNMPAGCTKFHKVESGDGCWSIEQKYGLTAAQFEALNPDVGADCSAGVWLGYHYCVGKDGGSGGDGEAPTSCGGGGGAFYTFPGGSISPVFHTTSHTIRIQPEPTQSIYTPDPPPRIRYSTTKDNGPLPTYESTDPDCKKDKGCGDWSCSPFGCPPGSKDSKGGGGGGGGGQDGECGLFGCDGGCGILGCAGLCGFFQCGCKDCIIKDGVGPGGNLPPDSNPEDCNDPKPFATCTVFVDIYVPKGKTTTTTEKETICLTSTVCTGKDGTTTTTASSSRSTSTMSFTDFDPLPTRVDDAMFASMASSLDAAAFMWDSIFLSPTGVIITTGAPTITGLCMLTSDILPSSSAHTYCDCGEAFGSTMPLIPSTTAPCAYTTLPHICRHGASPRENREYCNCEDYPHTLPTLTTPGNMCGYTSFPEPWPYTFTDEPGNVVACETSSVVSKTKTDCAGARYTVTRAPPKPTEKPRCVAARTYMNNCLLSGDVMHAQVWDRGVKVCDKGKNIAFASSESTFKIDCGGGASVSVTDNGAKLVYRAADGWESSIKQTHHKGGVETCGWIESVQGSVREIRGFQFENTFANDKCAGCATPELCGMEIRCEKYDGKCS